MMRKVLELLRTVPLGPLVLFLLACVLHVAMLASMFSRAMRGETGLGFNGEFYWFGLWVSLSALLVAAAMTGTMPRGGKIAASFLVPLSFLASAIAIDSEMNLALIAPVALPLLIAIYAVWAGFPQCHARLPPRPVTLLIWTTISLLSIPFVLAMLQRA
jgi:hypothetical protein